MKWTCTTLYNVMYHQKVPIYHVDIGLLAAIFEEERAAFLRIGGGRERGSGTGFFLTYGRPPPPPTRLVGGAATASLLPFWLVGEGGEGGEGCEGVEVRDWFEE